MDVGRSDDAVADEQIEADVSGISLSAVGFLPIGPVYLFARMCAVDWEADLDSPSPDFSGSSDGTDTTYGLSAQLRVWGLSIRQDCEIFDIEDAHRIDRISVGVTWILRSRKSVAAARHGRSLNGVVFLQQLRLRTAKITNYFNQIKGG